ncbi:MAG: LysR family glycine cleavage system transcriptional activator [Arenicella sp.]|jgi:LysR family glycine cleavage system transcriptional activator
MKKLPPLNWLRSFEASARHLNFTHAASELNLTQAAISKQIRNLEYSLGTHLFVRLPRGLELSEDGAAYLPVVKDSIAKLAAVTNELFGGSKLKVLTIRTSLAFFNLWLVQRLNAFHLENPDIDLRFTSNVWANGGDLEAGVDMELRYGHGDWPNLIAERLTFDKLIPVCSPELLERKPIESIDDLAEHKLLHVLGYQEGWAQWLNLNDLDGQQKVDPNQGMQFDTLISAFSAAAHGMGVALARTSLVEGLLSEGKLVAPLAAAVDTAEASYLVYRAGQCDAGVTKVFRDWLVSQADHPSRG